VRAHFHLFDDEKLEEKQKTFPFISAYSHSHIKLFHPWFSCLFAKAEQCFREILSLRRLKSVQSSFGIQKRRDGKKSCVQSMTTRASDENIPGASHHIIIHL